MGVGGVKGGHRMKVREALDLVTFLTGLLNSCLRMIIMENPKDTINLYGDSGLSALQLVCQITSENQHKLPICCG